MLRNSSSSHSPDIHGHLIDLQEVLNITELSHPFLAEQLNSLDDQIPTFRFLLSNFFLHKLLECNPIDGFLRFPITIEFRVDLLLVEEEVLMEYISVKSKGQLLAESAFSTSSTTRNPNNVQRRHLLRREC